MSAHAHMHNGRFVLRGPPRCELHVLIVCFFVLSVNRSKSGIVNVYGSSDASSWRTSNRPRPLKAIGNLTTSISALRFNHDSQLLAIASKTQKDQMRLVWLVHRCFEMPVHLRRNLQIHIPSLTAFSNWPTSSTPLGRVSSIDFSTGGEYIAIGNTRGRVLLYHLKDYDAHGGSQ